MCSLSVPAPTQKNSRSRPMVDTLSPDQRSALMSRIRTRDTTPELRVRRALHARGYRFRLHRRDLPGTPDIVLPRLGICIFVHGCFWHGHEDCPKATLPKTRQHFWSTKIHCNKQRDRWAVDTLEQRGWIVATIWECETSTPAHLFSTLENLGLSVRS